MRFPQAPTARKFKFPAAFQLSLSTDLPFMSNDNSASIVSKVWNYAHVLKNAGVGYGDYVEQITYLLFLKLADEMTELGFDNPIPAEFG
jgi:type I restriction enzyme M protein